MNANICSLIWSGTASISNTTHPRGSSHSNAKENMDLPGFMQISSWVVLARDESHYVPWHCCWTKYNQDPVQVPQVMQESRWCHLYPWYPKYRRWQVTDFMYYISGGSSRGINTTNIGPDPEPVLSTFLFFTVYYPRFRLTNFLTLCYQESFVASKSHRHNWKVYLSIKFFVEQVSSLYAISSREI